MDVRFVAHYGLNSQVRAKFGLMHRNKGGAIRSPLSARTGELPSADDPNECLRCRATNQLAAFTQRRGPRGRRWSSRSCRFSIAIRGLIRCCEAAQPKNRNLR